MRNKLLIHLLVGGLIAGTSIAQTPTNAVPGTDRGPAAPADASLNSGTNGIAAQGGTNGSAGLRLNFRGVPLEMVLNYLSDAAGFVIVLETEVRGKVDVWSNQPVSKDEAVELLNTVLAKNGYAAVRNGRTLKIVSRDDAKMRDLPVRTGNDPKEIERSDEMVNQVIPVRHANAQQLIQNLQPLIPTYATMTANESGNALLITATQTDVRRMVEIVKALDDSISSVAGIKVYPLKYADAKELSTVIKELFTPQATQQSGGGGGRGGFQRFFGGGGPGGGAPGAAAGGSGRASAANIRVVAVPDESSNSLIVSAPDDVLPSIDRLVAEVDIPVSDITELRVFHLRNADPMEMSDILAELFPDDSRDSRNSQQQFGFRGFFPGGRGGNTQAADSSSRTKKKGRVAAVPDARTSSLIVTAASELMPQIAEMVAQLDSSPAKKQKVYVYSLENADVQAVEQIVRDMFDRGTSGNRNSANQNSALGTRSQQNSQATPGAATSAGAGGGGQQQGNQLFR